MSDYKILKPSSFLSQRWKNGQGTTLELLKENILNSEDFRWRISMADVTTNGPFSTFENYDRTLLLLNGDGITLEFQSQPTAMLNHLLDSANFAGEDPTNATLHDGPITDFNIITHRDYCSAKIHVTNSSETDGCIEGDIILVYALDELKVQINSEEIVHIETGYLFYTRNSKIQIHDPKNFSYIGIQIHNKAVQPIQ